MAEEERKKWRPPPQETQEVHPPHTHQDRSLSLDSSLEKRGHSSERRGKRSRKRSRSRSSVSSVSSLSLPWSQGSREDLGEQLNLQERLQLKEDKKQKELLKALETPEEKRTRHLAKKEAKERKKHEKRGWGEEYMGYTNTDHPFGDNNLLGAFIWSKASLEPEPKVISCR
ncbi:splicing factor Cactin-like [Hemicordylus capensis]|uniref:splicing factor Cactin-like n=1 Tax=Hemicordylus capensis TaxID=884348 RepID=UPI002302403A|nr:splicing factor Cactin-like [Hemicordylus capensis]